MKEKLLKLTKAEMENLNSPMCQLNILNSLIKNLPTKETPGPEGFSGKCYQTFKKENTSSIQNVAKITKGGRLTNLFYEANIVLIPKPKNIYYRDLKKILKLDTNFLTDLKILSKILVN